MLLSEWESQNSDCLQPGSVTYARFVFDRSVSLRVTARPGAKSAERVADVQLTAGDVERAAVQGAALGQAADRMLG